MIIKMLSWHINVENMLKYKRLRYYKISLEKLSAQQDTVRIDNWQNIQYFQYKITNFPYWFKNKMFNVFDLEVKYELEMFSSVRWLHDLSPEHRAKTTFP